MVHIDSFPYSLHEGLQTGNFNETLVYVPLVGNYPNFAAGILTRIAGETYSPGGGGKGRSGYIVCLSVCGHAHRGYRSINGLIHHSLTYDDDS